MKFFTKDWATGELTDEEFEAAPLEYAKYVSGLKLPARVLDLDRLDLHDGIVRRVDVNGDLLQVALVTGDQQQGYFETIITYEFQPPSVVAEALQRLAGENIELIYTEVDRSGSAFVHRLLFSTYDDIDIPFRSVDIQQSPRASRE